MAHPDPLFTTSKEEVPTTPEYVGEGTLASAALILSPPFSNLGGGLKRTTLQGLLLGPIARL